MDEALVPHAKRLRIGRSNFRLLSDIKSKEYTLQLVYDVLRLSLFFKAFLVTTDVLEIYMQEFWATATVHHHSIRFKMDNKKHTVNLESFREMLHICPRLPHQPFVEPHFEEEILAFLWFLGHNGAIRRLTDVNINKLHQPWRSFAAIINKCLTGKSSGYDSLRLNTKIQRRAMRCIILGSRRDDHMFSMIKLVSRHQNTQQFGALLPIELTNKDIKNSNAYKEYYAVAIGVTPPKPKASVRKTKSSSDTTITPPTAPGLRLTTSEKGKQAAKASKTKSLSSFSKVAMKEAQQLKLATKRSLQQTHISQASGSGADEGTGSISEVTDVPTVESEEELSWNSTDEEGDDDEGEDGDGDDDDDDDQEVERDDVEEGGDDEQDFDEQDSDEEEFIHPGLSTHTEEEPKDEESFDPIPKTPKDSDDEGNVEENLGLNVGRKEGHNEEEEEDKLYRDSSSVSSQFVTSMLNPTLDVGMESIFETTSQMDAHTPTSVAPLPMSAPTLTSSTISIITTTQQVPLPPTIALSTLLQDLPNFGSLFCFDNSLRTLEMNKAVKVAIQIQSDHLCDEAQKENDEFLKTIDENMQKIIKEQVKEQVKTSYAVATDISEMELKKILIEKMEGNKSIQRSNKQRNLYKALVEAYESDKIILDTYRETITLKRRRDDDVDKDEEPSVGPDRGSKRRREGKEPESASAPMEKATKSVGKSTQGFKSRQASASESAIAEEPMQTTFQMEEPSHLEFDIGVEDQPIVQSSQHPE
nr:hypothetical protein [Tanacetum cinerariifolium]